MSRFVPGMRLTDDRGNLARVLADNEAPVYVGGIGDGAVPDMADAVTRRLVVRAVLTRYPGAEAYCEGCGRWCVEYEGDGQTRPSRAWYGGSRESAWLAAWKSL